VQVLRVIDGDTVEVQMGGRRERVRYIGVDTPESVAPNQPVECFGREASARNKELVEGKRVRLEKDVSDTDRFGRLLRYVWLGDEQINARLIAEGYANVATFPPDVRHQDLYRRLQNDARTAARGLWGACRP
jgi:micrococcal nuclease